MSEFIRLFMNDTGFFMLICLFCLGILAFCVMTYFDFCGFDHSGCNFPPKDNPND